MFLKELIISLLLMVMFACGSEIQVNGNNDQFKAMRHRMVEDQIISRGIKDKNVLNAMRKVKRHLFVLPEDQDYSYSDHPLPIGDGQTISQPYIVAIMSELAELNSKSKVLEIGTGSGYQAAVLAEIAAEVYTIEIVEPLYHRARKTLEGMDYKNIEYKLGDGYFGWKEKAPFDAIIVTAAPKKAPEPLIDQLKIGGRLVIPVGDIWQELIVIKRKPDGIERNSIIPVRFVPMTGQAQKKSD